SAQATVGPPGIDVTMTALLRFACDVTARVHCSMAKGTELRALLDVRCENGTITAENPIAPQHGYRLRVTGAAGERTETVAGGPARSAIAVRSSAGSTGLRRCMLNPSTRARLRSSLRA